ncbi:MAG: hypothetical protein A2Z14_09510 [Chloroflexi bacterium RBG_16_48_8]|nr:MAG: hypothetical protein A2Z14_09510 [Chloroflexi bacterium RBG_16_48_8]
MTTHKVTLLPSEKEIEVPTGTLISEAIQNADLEIAQPCGGQGRCGRCAVIIDGKGARRRSTIRLSSSDVEAGYALACQAVIEGDVKVTIPEQERVIRRLVTDKSAKKIQLPFPYDPESMQTVRAFHITLPEPTLDDNRDDVSRMETTLSTLGYGSVEIPLPMLRKMGGVLRQSNWAPWILLEIDEGEGQRVRMIDLSSKPIRPIGLAIDIGTTTVTIYLVDLESGEVINQAAEYNNQIAHGEDVISRIIFAGKGEGLNILGQRIRETIHTLLERLQKRTGIELENIHKVTISGNTTMIHLFLKIPPESIRLTPYIPVVNQPFRYLASDLELHVHPLASIDCLPGVASYVGADISAGVLACGLTESEELTLFIDVGTNGETVLGTKDWMVTCACSAGPAFEGAGVVDGMRATQGAIEEVWVHSQTFEPSFRVIGDVAPKGICGSGLISLLAELFVTGVIDRVGNVKLDLDTARVRQGSHGPEYVLAWGEETESGKDIAITKVDIENLMRAKAAIYAGFSVLASSVGLDLSDVQRVLVGGSFGQYINVEKAIQIGLLPDLPWDRFTFLGNTSVLGSYMALLSKSAREQVRQIAERMTYIELSADNEFFNAFTAALFLPHTEINRFPSVAEVWEKQT